MNNKKSICKKEQFVDEVFGENVEYVKIYDGNGIKIIFGMDNKIIIKEFRNIKELTEKYIEKYIECEFYDKMWKEQELESDEYQKENRMIKDYLKSIVNCVDEKRSKILINMEE